MATCTMRISASVWLDFACYAYAESMTNSVKDGADSAFVGDGRHVAKHHVGEEIYSRYTFVSDIW